MAKTVNPALFIGLGGTGHKVLLQLKNALLKNYGELPPATKILCLDTDKVELLSAESKIEYNKKNRDGSRSRVEEIIKFDKSERLAIPITNPLGLIKQEYIRNWVSDEVAPQIGPSDTGAKQIRQMGRFAIFENYTKLKFESEIEKRINALKNITQLKNTEYNPIGDPSIHLVFSPGGGTGAGSFIDIVTIIRKIDPRITIWGYMVMPEFYTEFPMTNSVVQNSYASLVEIDHLMGQDAIKDSDPNKNKWWSTYPKKPFTVDYTGNGNLVSLPKGSTSFFNNLYLFDNINEKGKFLKEVVDVYDRIGRILYLMVSGPGKEMTTSYSNNSDFRYPSSDYTYNKRRNYSSMGISQIILDRNFLKDIKKNQITRTIIDKYIYSSEKLEKTSLDTFIDENSWRENNGKDMIIDTLMPKNQLKYSLDTLYPSKFKKGEWSTEVKNNVDTHLNFWEQKCRTNCDKNKDKMLKGFNSKIEPKVSEYLSNEGGINQAKQFISHMIGAFNGMADEMERESNTHSSNLNKYNKEVPIFIESIISEENSWGFSKKEKVKDATDVFINHSERVLLEKWEEIRKETAKLFLNICIDSLKDISEDLNNLENLFNEAYSEVERDNQKIMNKSDSDKDFERSIHYFYKDLVNNNISDINLGEAFNAIDFSSIRGYKKVNEITNLINNYAKNTTAYKSIDELTVESILEKLDKPTMRNIINYLDESSAICIDVDPTFLLTSDKTTMEKFGFLLVGNSKTSIFKTNEDYYSQLSSEGGYTSLSMIDTGDTDKITLLKIGGMFPGSAIKRVSEYKDKFESSSSFHYSDIYFEQNAMDLIDGPSDAEEEGLKWFAVGSALGKIYLFRGALVLEMENKRTYKLYEGTRNKTNRAEALKVFKKNKEYISFIEEYFNRYYDNNGKPVIKQRFSDFHKNIKSVEILGKQFKGMDRESEEYDNIFNEQEALNDFSMTLGFTIDDNE